MFVDDDSALPSAFDGNPAQPAGHFSPNELSDLGGARETDLGDVRVGNDGLSDFDVAGQDLEDSGGKVGRKCGEEEGRKRGGWMGFENDGVAGGEGRGDLPRCEHCRKDIATLADGFKPELKRLSTYPEDS